ncbi:MAG: hypothetical protein JWO67_1455 [Streptosporangiaceae bacterium]|nr:hypothetical protein [Streptosporangiaceae bacterium]
MTTPTLRVVRGQTTVEVYGEARLSLTKVEAHNLAADLRRAIGWRRRINWALTAFKMGVRCGRALGKTRQAHTSR